MVWLCEPKTADELALCYMSINNRDILDWQEAHLISVSTSLSALEYQTR